MLYGLLLFVKKYSFKRGSGSLTDIKVLSNQIIMPKKFLSVVKVKDKLLILGISETGITLLKEIDADESYSNNASEINYNQGFSDILKKFLPK